MKCYRLTAVAVIVTAVVYGKPRRNKNIRPSKNIPSKPILSKQENDFYANMYKKLEASLNLGKQSSSQIINPLSLPSDDDINQEILNSQNIITDEPKLFPVKTPPKFQQIMPSRPRPGSISFNRPNPFNQGLPAGPPGRPILRPNPMNPIWPSQASQAQENFKKRGKNNKSHDQETENSSENSINSKCNARMSTISMCRMLGAQFFTYNKETGICEEYRLGGCEQRGVHITDNYFEELSQCREECMKDFSVTIKGGFKRNNAMMSNSWGGFGNVFGGSNGQLSSEKFNVNTQGYPDMFDRSDFRTTSDLKERSCEDRNFNQLNWNRENRFNKDCNNELQALWSYDQDSNLCKRQSWYAGCSKAWKYTRNAFKDETECLNKCWKDPSLDTFNPWARGSNSLSAPSIGGGGLQIGGMIKDSRQIGNTFQPVTLPPQPVVPKFPGFTIDDFLNMDNSVVVSDPRFPTAPIPSFPGGTFNTRTGPSVPTENNPFPRNRDHCSKKVVPTSWCRAAIQYWTFDKTDGKCKSMIFGGCAPIDSAEYFNRYNHFYTEDDCKKVCEGPEIPELPSLPSSSQSSQPAEPEKSPEEINKIKCSGEFNTNDYKLTVKAQSDKPPTSELSDGQLYWQETHHNYKNKRCKRAWIQMPANEETINNFKDHKNLFELARDCNSACYPYTRG